MKLNYTYLLILIVLLTISCNSDKNINNKNNTSTEKENSTASYDIKIKYDVIGEYYFDANQLKAGAKRIDESKNYIGIYCLPRKTSNKRFYIDETYASITIEDLKTNKFSGFSIKGSGYKYCNRISAITILENMLWFYDLNSRKTLKYDFTGRFINEKKITNEEDFPFNITSAISIDSLLLVTGINYIGWEKFINGEGRYNNLFLIDTLDNKVIWQKTLYQKGLEDHKDGDVVFNPQNNMQEVIKNGNDFYLFDVCSGSIIKFNLVNNTISNLENIILPDEVFKKHIEMPYKKCLSSDTYLDKWFNSGSRLVEFYVDGNFIICYISEYDEGIKGDKDKLIFINNKNKKLEYIINFGDNKRPKFIENGEIIFLGYEENGVANNEITLYKVNYKELF